MPAQQDFSPNTFPPELSKSRLISLLHDAGYTIKEMVSAGYGLDEGHCRSSVADFTSNTGKAEDARQMAKSLGFAVPPKPGSGISGGNNSDPLKYLVELYKDKVRTTNNVEELYKWRLIQKFQGKPNINADDFALEIKDTEYQNLVYHLGRGVLQVIARSRPEQLRDCFRRLFDENEKLSNRLVEFKRSTLVLYREVEPGSTLSHHQDERSMATYLTFRFPERYTFYQSTYYRALCRLLNVKTAPAGSRYIHYLELVKNFAANQVQTDSELQELKLQFLTKDAYPDEQNLILAQDIFYQTLEKDGADATTEDEKQLITLLKKVGLESSKFYFDQSAELLRSMDVEEGDLRLTFGAQNNYLNVTIGQRYCLGMYSGSKSWRFISTNKEESTSTIDVTQFDGKPEAYYFKCADPMDVTRRIELIKTASKSELERTDVSGYRKATNAAFERAVFDNDYRTQILTKAFGDVPSGAPDKKAINMDISLNTIFYGPPGTGKTYKLGQYQEQFFTDREIHRSAEELLRERVKPYPYWKIFAAILSVKDRYIPVSEILIHPLVKAKISEIARTPQNTIWSILQSYADLESSQMNEKYRGSIQLFNKNQNSEWSIIESKKAEVPNIIDEDLLRLASNPVVADNQQSQVKIRYNFITFHQKYGYEDFIEGIKPLLKQEEEQSTGSDLQFELKRGVFYLSCVEALKLAGYNNFEECYADTKDQRRQKFAIAKSDSSKQFAIMIDEINRANISAVFGELITLLEDDKRMGAEHEMWVELPYSNEKFCVPGNLFVIGSMNTADRSIALLDIALRRRFEFKALYPEYHDGQWWAPLLQSLNQAVFSLKKNPDFFIGHAFFINKPESARLAILNMKIIPLLYEYCQNNSEAVKRILAEAGVSVKPTSIRENFQLVAE